MSAFKTYVVKEYTDNGAVFEREVHLALKEDLQKEREGTPPDLSKAVSTKELVKMLNSNSLLKKTYAELAAEKGVPIFLLKKKTLLEKLKGLFT